MKKGVERVVTFRDVYTRRGGLSGKGDGGWGKFGGGGDFTNQKESTELPGKRISVLKKLY